jgi:hypothetical protein
MYSPVSTPVSSPVPSTHDYRGLNDQKPGTPRRRSRSDARSATSNLSPTLGRAPETSAPKPLSAYEIGNMLPTAVPKRVDTWDPREMIKNHFFPGAPENVDEILAATETAIREVRESRPVDAASYAAFQQARKTALDLEFRATILTGQAEPLENAASLWSSVKRTWNSHDLPKEVAALFGTVDNISHADLKTKASQVKEEAKQAWQDVGKAWDTALVHYLNAHQLDRKDLEAGFARAGSPAYAVRILPPVLLSAAMAIPAFIQLDTAKQKFHLSLGNAALALFVAGFAQPVASAMTTLTSVTWSDRLFNHASDIQDLLGTKMIDEVDQQLHTALDEAHHALAQWNGVKDGDDESAKTEALAALKTATQGLVAADEEYSLRVDLNRIYIQGFQNQGIANGLKYYANLSVGIISALAGPQWGASIQLGAAATHFAAHMAISGNDEKNKQLRMFYLRMRASAPRPGETTTEELTRFAGEIRDPFKVAQGALQQIFTARVRTLDTEIADALDIQPNEWRKVLAYRDFAASGGEAANFPQADIDVAQQLEQGIAATMGTLSDKKRSALEGKIALRNNTAQDIAHVGANAFSKVSQDNKEEVFLGLQVTPPASGVLEQLKNLVGPLTPEFRIGMRQGWARIKLPQEVMTTYGLAYWASFQLGICGENGPLILSKFAQAMLALYSYCNDKTSPSEKETLNLQSVLVAINLAVTVALVVAATRLLNIVVHPKGTRESINPLAGGRSSMANTTYLGALLQDRGPQRDEAANTDPNARFQSAGLVTKDHRVELLATIKRRLAVLAQESGPASGAREKFLEGAELLDQMQQAINEADPAEAAQIEAEFEQRLAELKTVNQPGASIEELPA